jgi:hypothetical protein
VGATARLDENTLNLIPWDRERARLHGRVSLFFQDSWRWRPTLTFNYGLAWQVQMPLKAGNNVLDHRLRRLLWTMGSAMTDSASCSRLAAPRRAFIRCSSSTPPTRRAQHGWNNIAPNFGVAWRPNVQNGWLRTLLGDPEQATLRAGYSERQRGGFDEFTGVYNNNPPTYNANRNNNTGSNHLLVNPGETWPCCDTGAIDSARPPEFRRTRYRLRHDGQQHRVYDPFLEVPFTRSFSAGFQRSVTRDMAFEVRKRARGNAGWVEENWNENNVIENGFRTNSGSPRQPSLARAGRVRDDGNPACSFAYRGPGRALAAADHLGADRNPSDTSRRPAAYQTAAAVTAFTNTTFLGRLSLTNPNVLTQQARISRPRHV